MIFGNNTHLFFNILWINKHQTLKNNKITVILIFSFLFLDNYILIRNWTHMIKFMRNKLFIASFTEAAPNIIISMSGICVQKQPIMIVMELVPGGSLLNYLRTSADKLSTKALLGNFRFNV